MSFSAIRSTLDCDSGISLSKRALARSSSSGETDVVKLKEREIVGQRDDNDQQGYKDDSSFPSLMHPILLSEKP